MTGSPINACINQKNTWLLERPQSWLYRPLVHTIVMYGCESWTIKKAEHHRFDAFELWCWRSLLGVPWAARRSNQSMLKEINSDYSLEGWILKLKLQYFGRLMRRPTHWKRPDAGKDWRQKEKGKTEDEMIGWHHWLSGHESGQTTGDGEGQGGLACCSLWAHKESDTIWWLNNSKSKK